MTILWTSKRHSSTFKICLSNAYESYEEKGFTVLASGFKVTTCWLVRNIYDKILEKY